MTNVYRVNRPDIVVTNMDELGIILSERLSVPWISFRREYHPDGAPAPRVNLSYTLNDYKDFEGKKVLTVYRRSQLPDRDSVARHLVNYPRLVNNLTDEELFNVDEVDVLYPYWINARADHNPMTDKVAHVRKRDAGRGLEYKFDAQSFKEAGAERILTFHPHFHREPGVIDVEGIEVVCLDAVPSMVKYAKERLGISGDALVLNPDMKPAKEGRYDVAHEFARYGDFEIDHLEKQRLDEKTVSHDGKKRINAKGRDVVIVDDIGSTFNTVRGAVYNIDNAKTIDIMVVHPVLPYEGLKNVNRLISDDNYPVRSITGTHTINSDISEIPIEEAILDFYSPRKDELKLEFIE